MANVTAIGELRAARARLRAVADDLGGSRQFGPRSGIVNPPRWEIGHVGWFQEYWCLRNAGSGAPGASILPNADALYNSATVLHDTRWDLDLPEFEATLLYRDTVLERTLEQLLARPQRDALYFAMLAARHEDMHAEAFHYMRQTWGYQAPEAPDRAHPGGEACAGDADLAGGPFELGAETGAEFVFDNEKWGHPVVLAPFRIARTAVRNSQYLAFVEEGGYRRREFWSTQGWAWLQGRQKTAPHYWQKADGAWRQRRFDRLVPVAPEEPVMHVGWHEAQAYCKYAGRRLPTEAEWEYAALWNPRTGRRQPFPWDEAPWSPDMANLESSSIAPADAYPAGDSPCGCRQMVGNLWEWTSSAFLPYPGFLRDPYKEYSEPWFGTHKVLRGGCFATSRRIGRAGYRNFFTADRTDVFAGFRTCAQ